MTTPLSENAETNKAVVGKHNVTSPFSLRPAWTLVLALPGAVILAGALFAGGSLYVSQDETKPSSAEVAQFPETTSASETTASIVGASADAKEDRASLNPDKFEQSLSAGSDTEEPEAGRGGSLEDRLGAAETSGSEPREVFTSASVARSAASGSDVAVAESEADVLALEGAMKEKAAAVAVTLDDNSGETSDEPAETAMGSGSSGMLQATASEHVNMRAGPENEAEVLAVVPKGAQLSASAECPQWCEVVYEGKRGWIYKGFVRKGS